MLDTKLAKATRWTSAGLVETFRECFTRRQKKKKKNPTGTGKILFTQSLFIHSESANTADYSVVTGAAGDTRKTAVAAITAAVILLSLAI